MSARNIDEVIHDLDKIIEECLGANDPMGYFPALYSKVTIAVKDGIREGRFENGERMEQLDVIFANRYINAYNGYRKEQNISKSWKIAFDGTQHWWPIVLQHLLAGMNAHINLDLGIAAAQVCPEDSIKRLKKDFDEINVILANLVNDVQDELAQIWPVLKIVDRVAGKIDESIVNFSMDKARQAAWSFAQELAYLNEQEREFKIIEKDNWTSLFGFNILYLGTFSLLPKVIRLGERGNIAERIRILI